MTAESNVSSGGLYRHYKGGWYRVQAIARVEAEPEKQVVIYRSLTDGEVWSRPLENFAGLVQLPDGQKVWRFQAYLPFHFETAGTAEFWPSVSVSVQGALRQANERFQQEHRRLMEQQQVEGWRRLKTEIAISRLVEAFAPRQLITRPLALDGFPPEQSVFSLQDAVVFLLIRLRLHPENLQKLRRPDEPGVDPQEFIAWLDVFLNELGFTEQWMRENLLVDDDALDNLQGRTRGKKSS